MQLPAPLRAAVDRALEGVSASELSQVAAALSQRYRAEIRDGTSHLADGPAALAYIGARMPATYAAVRRSFAAVAEACPGFAPSTTLDAGAGPGTALWAATDCWPTLADAVLIESSTAIRNLGEKLFAGGEPTCMSWHTADLTAGLPDLTPRDLVTLAYVLNELSSGARDKLIDRLWQLTAGVLVIVEPARRPDGDASSAPAHGCWPRAPSWSRPVRTPTPARSPSRTGAISPSVSSERGCIAR
jgi:ribosomal protein RSM22 (predicted rRNA methylase)